MSDELIRAYTDRSDAVVEVFKQYAKMADDALTHLWLPEEIKVEKDKQAVLTQLTPAERHGLIFTLKLFTAYEVKAGKDYWAGRFQRIMKGPEFSRMASVFSMFELAVHKPFYQKINEVLGLDTDEFYASYVDDPTLKARMDCVSGIINHPNDLVSLGSFTMVEGGVLYSNFAFLKHFSANGKFVLNQVPRGVNFSLADENLHQQGGAMAFRHLVADAKADGVLEKLYGPFEDVVAHINAAARAIYEHEAVIIDKTFEKGPCPGIDPASMRVLVMSRLNNCLQDLGLPPVFEFNPDDNTIAEWFYSNIQGYQSNDFFAGIGNAYNRNWDEDEFVFAPFPESTAEGAV